MRSRSQNQLKKKYDATARHVASIVKQEHPDLVGILVHGSVARGEPGPYSDIDMLGVTGSGRRKPSEYSFFDGDVYVGVGFLSVAELEKEFNDPNRFYWARGSAEATRLLYDPRGILRKIMLRWKNAKPSYQILQKSLWDSYHNIIEYSGKLRNGWTKHDEYLTRYSARVLAAHVERAIIALNDLSIISENYVWHQILNAEKRPQHIRSDYPVARAMIGTRDLSKVCRSAMRLGGETLRLIRNEFGARAKHPRFIALLAEPLEDHSL